MDKVNKATFKKYVAFAVCILEVLCKEWGETVVDRLVHLYVLHVEIRAVILRDLIRDSEVSTAAWDSLLRIVKHHYRERTLLPPELADWHAEVLEKTRRRPTTRGRDRCADAHRNYAIVIAVSQLIAVTHLSNRGLKATRNRYQKSIWIPECCYAGGSACDAVGVAVGRVFKEFLCYKCIERLWTKRASTGINLESIPSIAFGVLSPSDAVDLVM